MNSDFKDLLKVLNDYKVHYLVVGGYAVMTYTEPRYTKDLDIWIEASPKNARAIFRALEKDVPITRAVPWPGHRSAHRAWPRRSQTVFVDLSRGICGRP
jgi:hypothetical protein